LSDEALRFYKSGRPFLQQYLPFWLATLVERLIVVFVPLIAVMYPLFKLIPSAYDWIMRSKIERLYDEMKSVESAIEGSGRQLGENEIDARVDQLEERASRLSLPAAYGSSLYTLRSHIGLIRRHLESVRKRGQPHI
jgi:hypothetical protein